MKKWDIGALIAGLVTFLFCGLSGFHVLVIPAFIITVLLVCVAVRQHDHIYHPANYDDTHKNDKTSCLWCGAAMKKVEGIQLCKRHRLYVRDNVVLAHYRTAIDGTRVLFGPKFTTQGGCEVFIRSLTTEDFLHYVGSKGT